MKSIKNRILITGAAGFIGAALVKRMISNNDLIIGIDNINNYYDKTLKINRIKNLNQIFSNNEKWIFEKISLENKDTLEAVFAKYSPNIVVNLGAQAGVRHSIENPDPYITSNIVGFFNVLECCRNYNVENLIYASSSSVYGGIKKIPFSEDQLADNPISLYAATKKSNELIAHSYSHLYNLPCTGLRFFTVYGPWGRPDMAPMIFTKSIIEKKPIKVFNYGKMKRDFTYIDDIVEAISKCCFKPATPSKSFDSCNSSSSISNAPHKIFNVGNGNSIEILEFIEILEKELGIKAIKDFVPIQLGDVEATEANTSKIYDWIGFRPKTNLKVGLSVFVKWYKNYYKSI